MLHIFARGSHLKAGAQMRVGTSSSCCAPPRAFVHGQHLILQGLFLDLQNVDSLLWHEHAEKKVRKGGRLGEGDLSLRRPSFLFT